MPPSRRYSTQSDIPGLDSKDRAFRIRSLKSSIAFARLRSSNSSKKLAANSCNAIDFSAAASAIRGALAAATRSMYSSNRKASGPIAARVFLVGNLPTLGSNGKLAEPPNSMTDSSNFRSSAPGVRKFSLASLSIALLSELVPRSSSDISEESRSTSSDPNMLRARASMDSPSAMPNRSRIPLTLAVPPNRCRFADI